MQNKYKVSSRNGQPAIFTDRGLVCLMEAGNQSTREKDAAEIVAILNAAPDLLAVAKALVEFADGNNRLNLTGKLAESVGLARAAIAKAEGNA
jgi:hypothetical protein